MNYKKAQDIISDIEKKGSIYGLECMRELMRELKNPQDNLKFVHVTGTNGKGSVIAYLSSVLKQAGYLTGRFTSPAVFLKRETISINDENISEEDYVRLLDIVLQAREKVKLRGVREATAFEIETAIAFLYFKEKKCDIVLLEAGLGGLLDSTNIIKNPVCSVIMPVSFDHEKILGSSLEKIAENKAGIIKEKCPVVSAKQENIVENILNDIAKNNNTVVSYPFLYKIAKKDSDFYQKFVYNEVVYEISLQGLCQIENATVAIEVLNILNESGFLISKENIIQGLKNTKHKGRFSIISEKPYVIMDGAHNVGAAMALQRTLSEFIKEKNINRVVMIAGMLSDKEYENVIPIVAKNCNRLYTIGTNVHRRQLDSDKLFNVAVDNDIEAFNADNVQNAVEMAMSELGSFDLLLAFGSFSFLAQFEKEILSNMVKD